MKFIEENIFIPNSKNTEGKVKEVNPMIFGFRDSRFLPVKPSSSSVSVKNIGYREKFRAPELSESKYDEEIDVFAFSGILYKLITNKSQEISENSFFDHFFICQESFYDFLFIYKTAVDMDLDFFMQRSNEVDLIFSSDYFSHKKGAACLHTK